MKHIFDAHQNTLQIVVSVGSKTLPYQRFKIMSYENVIWPHITVDNTTHSALFMKIS